MNRARWVSDLAALECERDRQDMLKAEGKFPYTCADAGLSHLGCLAVLMEEVGEVARAVLVFEHESGTLAGTEKRADARRRLRSELIQVGAVTLAWLEGLTDK